MNETLHARVCGVPSNYWKSGKPVSILEETSMRDIHNRKKRGVVVWFGSVDYRCALTLKQTFMSLEMPSPPRVS